jgi:hypothetical protein
MDPVIVDHTPSELGAENLELKCGGQRCVVGHIWRTATEGGRYRRETLGLTIQVPVPILAGT